MGKYLLFILRSIEIFPVGKKSVEILSFKHYDTKSNHLVLKADMERTKSYHFIIRNYLFLIK